MIYLVILIFILLIIIICFKKELFSVSKNKIKTYINNLNINFKCSKINTRRNYSDCCFTDDNKKYFIHLLNKYFDKNPQKIDKIIHQIWIGPKPIPHKWINTFKKFIEDNSDWKYKLWREKDIQNLNMINKNIYNIEKSYNGKSDIARYEILYKYGGIYIDADAICLDNDLNDLIKKTNKSGIFLGRENKKNRSGLASGTIGASKNNPIMLYAIKVMNKIYDNCKNVPPYKSIGPYFCDQIFLDMPITIFPYYYFYPLWWFNQIIPDVSIMKLRYPHSYMYHLGYTTNNLNSEDIQQI